ncbi:MAG: ribonuclease H [Phenylobacterium sp.]
MADTIRIWVETSHHAAFRCGGWAFVRKDAEGLSGAAGGDRSLTPERAILAGLAQALQGLPAAVAVEVLTSNPQLVALPALIAAFTSGEEPPTENLDLWAQLTTALKSVRIGRAENRPGTPTAFATAWAELARDKAKATGPFRSPIPKPNLAKAGA